MNKLISTLLCGVLALGSASAADAIKYFKLKTGIGSYLVQASKDGKDSTIVVAAGLANTDAALWEVRKSSPDATGNSTYQFKNKKSGVLKVDGMDVFGVGAPNAVMNVLDTIGVTASSTSKTIFYTKNGVGKTLYYDTAKNGVLTSDDSKNGFSIELEKPGKTWLTSTDLPENTTYTFDLLSELTGVEGEFMFENVTPNDSVFKIKSVATGKYLSLDSANWTASSTVNLVDQEAVFGFKLGFGKSAFNHFGLYYDAATDQVAIAVRDSSLGWDAANKKMGATVVGWVPAFIGKAKFLTEEVVTTVASGASFANDSVPSPKYGVASWGAAPELANVIATPFGKNPYVLTVVSKATPANNGKIVARAYGTLTTDGGAVLLDKTASTVEPENQWYIKETVTGGKYFYDVVNRYYGTSIYTNQRVTTTPDGNYVFGTDTLKLTEVTNPAGFKVFDAYELAANSVKFNIVNSLGAEGATLVLNDTLLVAGDKDGIQFNVMNAKGYASPDTFPAYSNHGLYNKNNVLGVYNLYTLDGADTLFVALDTTELVLSKYVTPTPFIIKSDTETAYKLLPIHIGTISNGGTKTLRVHENGAKTTVVDFDSSLATLFTISTDSGFEYAKLAVGHYTFQDASATGTGLDLLTKKDNGDAKFLRVGDELKAASTASDFAFWVDKAFVLDTTVVESLTPAYYIVKNAEYIADGDSLKGDFMTVKGKYDAANDSIIFKATKALVNADSAKKVATASAFLFRITDTEDVFEVIPFSEVKKTVPARLALINGVVVSSTDKEALPVLVKRTSDIPVANEDINAEAAVKVIAEAGAVRVLNAAGKSVMISNILGQTVASTVITSDDATIAAPKGIVVVAVEGESAVKAIVK